MTRKPSVAVLTAIVVLAGLQLNAAAAPKPVATLRPGQAVFWNGGHVGSDPLYSAPAAPATIGADRCELGAPCFTYTLVTKRKAARLRVAFDTPARDDGFQMKLVSPDGTETTKTNGNAYTMEVFITDPPAGTWTIAITPYSADHASFRMRAKLESKVPAPQANAKGQLLPNLRPTRMWEFGFVSPAGPNGTFPPDDANPPLEAGGYDPFSCSPDEQAEGAVRCLRFSFGLANAGRGNFDVRYQGDRSGAHTEAFQCVQRASGDPMKHAAGTTAFHNTHGHFHYDDVIEHRLYRVRDRATRKTIRAGTGKKLGYSPADQGIADWRSFGQAAAGTSGTAGNCVAEMTSRLGMSPGWGDAYRYQRPGNYVEFGSNGDGYYIVQTIADPLDHVIESSESDNISYAYLRIVGEEVDVIETGLGMGPWDPRKIVFDSVIG